MDSLPSPAASPVLTPQPSSLSLPPAAQQFSRKRARSTSSEASSSKRAMSEDPNALPTGSNVDSSDSAQTESFAALKLSMPSSATVDHDIESYMQTQEQGVEPMAIVPVEGATPNVVNPDAPEDRYKLITQLKKSQMTDGAEWYIVSRSWYRRWEKACTGEVDKEGEVLESQLGPIDNSSLVESSGFGRRASFTEGVDVEFVPKVAWDRFVGWYGEPSHTLMRKVILRGMLKEPVLELHPPSLQIMELIPSDATTLEKESIKKITLSEADTLETMCRKAVFALEIDVSEQYRIWKVDGLDLDGTKYPSGKLLAEGGALMPLSSDNGKTLTEARIQSEDSFVVELAFDGKWIVDAERVPNNPDIITGNTLSYPDTRSTEPRPLFEPGTDFISKMQSSMSGGANKAKDSAQGMMNGLFDAAVSKGLVFAPGVSSKFGGTGKTKAEKGSTAIQPGLLGLSNMGNTCFMNSALQCLAHTESLVEYFLTGVFQGELNPSNPLGMQGAIAEVFGSLLRRIWNPTTSATTFAPREFKAELQRFAPQFSGYQQHDSQELVAFLLDGLHEDLNRVLQKPYVEKPDWEGGGDKELVDLALKSWEGYMKRNDSVIVDLFQGQYKSTLICPECQKVSITFDPFMYLTLPLPVQKKWTHSIFYVPWDNSKPHVKIPIEVNRNASFRDVRRLLGRWMDVEPDNLLTLEVFSNRFYKDLDDNVLVSDMSSTDNIVCFELPCHAQQSRTWKPDDDPEKDPVILAVHLTRESSTSRTSYRSGPNGFAHPFVVVLTPEQASDKRLVYEAIVDRLQRWTTNARDLFQWEHDVPEDRVPIQLANARTNVTEIKESGEVNVLEPEEGDIVDAKGVILEEDEAEGALQDSVRKVGPKPDLFEMNIQTGNDKFGTGSSWSITQRWERWESREGGPLVLKGDALYCEWDENLKNYYFGDDVKHDQGRWHASCWEDFIHPEYEEALAAARGKSKKDITLYDCLEEFTKEEQLGEDDLWYCPRCKKHQQATKKFDVWTVPDILVVHLKRFSNSRMLRDKIDAFVDFPIEGLDLGAYCGERDVVKRLQASGEDVTELGVSELEEPMLYDLYAVDEHLGGLGGGHYRAYAKHHETGQWLHFDDSYVREIDASEAVNANAYLLFYKRRTSRPIGGKTYFKIQEARNKSEVPTQLPTPEEDGSAPSSASRSILDNMPAFRYPTPVTNAHASPAMSSTPPPDDSEPPLLEGQFSSYSESYKDHRRSAPGSPSSSTGAEPDTDFSENLTWPNDSDDWENRPGLDEHSEPTAEHEWDSFRSENTMASEASEMGIASSIESDLLDIDE
ncbi:cysteine proteinase [Schizopora paradoxa]|uniref:ubiquitinyl hydrolase 1 n=1 Tax=Schizopora paradoxa TaxID=27342 RepID=A0A0H2S784_9AGAM|nr:cysteine proteinase [Schizopora paradoxa]